MIQHDMTRGGSEQDIVEGCCLRQHALREMRRHEWRFFHEEVLRGGSCMTNCDNWGERVDTSCKRNCDNWMETGGECAAKATTRFVLQLAAPHLLRLLRRVAVPGTLGRL